MHIGYKLVIFNIFVLVSFCLLFVIYRFVYPKRTPTLLSLLLALSLVPIISIFRTGVYSSGDMGIDVIKAMSFYTSLMEGNLTPTWAGDLNATYGYPEFIFMYPLPYYLASLFHALGFSFVVAIKLVLVTAFVGSSLTMYLWLKEKLTEQAALVGSVFYLYAPYHFVDLHFRVDIGESLSFVFLPLVFLGLDKVFLTRKGSWMCLLSMAIALLLLSHQAIALFFIPCSLAYAGFLFLQMPRRDLKALLLAVLLLCLGFGLAAFYWLPVLGELQYTHQIQLAKTVLFAPVSLYLYSPWRFGLLFQGPKGELSYPVGYVQLCLLGLSLFLLRRQVLNKSEKQFLVFALVSFLILFILAQQISQPVWDALPIMKNIQFSYRLSGVLMFFTAIVAAIATKQVKRKWFTIAACSLAIFMTVLNWGNRQVISTVTDRTLANQLPLSAEGLQVASPRWTNIDHIWMSRIPGSHLEIQRGQGSVEELQRTSNAHIYSVNARSKLYVIEHTLYFPGWVLTIDGRPAPILVTREGEFDGIMSFWIPPGKHEIMLRFLGIQVQYVGKLISLASLLLSGFLLIGGAFNQAHKPALRSA